MLTAVNPKLPMRNKALTRAFYVMQLGFQDIGNADFEDYLMLAKDAIEIHFFGFKNLDPAENYGQIYLRTNDIDALYEELCAKNANIHPNGHLSIRPWGQKEFSMLDPDNNLLTFGESIIDRN